MERETVVVLVGVGGGFVLGAIVGAIVSKSRTKPPAGAPLFAEPPFYRVSLTTSGNVDIGGGWTMHDVSAMQSRLGKAMIERGFARGTSVPLVLSHGASPVLYYATVIGPIEGGYSGQWTRDVPPAGPQLIDFGPQHVLL